MTALVCMITGVYTDPQFQASEGFIVGAKMTSAAFDSFLPGARYVLAIGVMLFAYSTMISWSYYGERAWEYLFGSRFNLIYRVIFVVFVVLWLGRHAQKRARLYRYAHLEHGLSQHHRRRHSQPADQGVPARVLGPTEKRRDAALQVGFRGRLRLPTTRGLRPSKSPRPPSRQRPQTNAANPPVPPAPASAAGLRRQSD